LLSRANILYLVRVTCEKRLIPQGRNVMNKTTIISTHFVRNLKRGTEKYKSKLPFKCFNCGRVGHYAKKCPFEENKILHKKNIIYSKEDNISSVESDGEEMEVRESLFITQETQNDDHKNYEIDEINSKEEFDAETEETNIEYFWGSKDITKSEHEDK
jgi:hypothetical protein